MTSLFGCNKKQEEEISTGARVDNSNTTAPKFINSKNIVEFSVNFYIYLDEPLDDDYSGQYDFKIKNNILIESSKFNISETIDEKVLSDLQDIIDKYKLVNKNGINTYTAGLAPEYQPYNFKAIYDSGEELNFSEDNDPDCEWAKDIVELLRKAFIDLGHSELKPSLDATTITNFYLEFNIGNIGYQFCPIDNMEDMELLKTTFDFDGKTQIEEVSDLDEDLYTALANLLIELNTKRFNTGKQATNNECNHNNDGYYEIYIDFNNGKQIYDYSNDKKQVDDFNRDSSKFIELFDTFMSTHNKRLYEND